MEVINFYEQIADNKRRTWAIMTLFVAVITTAAYVFGQASGYGSSWVGTALLFSAFSSVGSYFWGDKVILAISGAREADPQREAELYSVVENLSLGTGLPKPKVYLIEDTAPNAFASGRDPQHAVVCVTTGLLQKLNRSELEGVLAHELSHIKNYDIRLMAIVTVLVGMITLLADWFTRSLWWGGGGDRRSHRESRSGQLGAILMLVGILLAALTPLIAKLMQLALSRQREFLADSSAVQITRQPSALASALAKLAADREPLEAANKATAHLYVVSPFKGKDLGGWFVSLFQTHPPIEERIQRLMAM